MLTLKVECSMCGGEKKPALEFYVDDPKQLNLETIKREVEAAGWIVQVNGDNVDTYCTKKCAE